MKNLILALSFTLCWICSAEAQEIFQELDYPYEVKNIALKGGETMAYIDEGSGKETLVFIHGLGSYLPAWKKNIEELKKNHRCIAIDLIGYGKSSKPKESFNLKDQSQFIGELLRKLNVQNYNLVGHSMGGQISIHHALDFKKNVNTLILVAPAGIETFTAAQKTLFRNIPPASMMVSDEKAIRKNLEANFYNFPEEAEFMISDRIAMKEDPQFELYARAVVNGIKGMVDQEVFDQLGELTIPTLVLMGQEDALIPNRMMNPELNQQRILDIAKEQINHAETHIIPAAGHMLMFEKADEVNNLIDSFVKNYKKR